MRALVTGSHGFAGTPLVRLLRERGATVVGLGSSERPSSPDLQYLPTDLRDAAAVREAVDAADPDAVFHLAARAGRGDAEEARRTLAVNANGALHLMQALVERARPVRVVLAGSSAQYGTGPGEAEPVTESAPQVPLGVYGWSKVGAEVVALARHAKGRVEVVAARPFNHTGPGEPPHLVCSAFARGVARIEAGAEPVLEVGALDTVRDFTDVRDVAAAYVALAERGAPGRVYNVCSGRGTRTGDVLAMLLDKSEATVEVRADAGRPAGLPRQVGSHALLSRDTGWTPAISLDRSLHDLLEEWRRRLRERRGDA